jgi:hypothetical protein
MSTYNWGRIITKKITVGGVGVTGCDFNFVTAANQNEQPINLTAAIPAKARILDVYTFTDVAFTGAVSLGVKIGTATGGTQIAVSADVIAANAINQTAVGAGFTWVAVTAAAATVWLSATPGANWSLATAGKLSCYITYIDVTGL